MSNYISHKGVNWEYEEFGCGNEPLLAFHGFGNHASDFKVLEPALGKRFRIISFIFPYHRSGELEEGSRGGASQLPISNSPITKDDLRELFGKFLTEHAIKSFSLMGYSLGGKIALQLIELFPDRINDVILFAPDGMGNRWDIARDGVTNTLLGRKIFQRIINDPSRLFKIVNLLAAMKIVHPKMADFVHYQLSTRERRLLVWNVWMCFRYIKPDIRNIQHIINTKKISFHLFFGKHDGIIPPSIGKKFVRGLTDKSALHILDSGHRLIQQKTNAALQKELVRITN